MIIESSPGRRVIGRLERGSDLVAALAEICTARGVRAGEVRALGALEEVVVCEYDQAKRAYKEPRRFSGPLEILSLAGNVSEKDGEVFLHAHVTVSRDRDSGVEVLGGHLVTGRVFACEFVVDAWDDVALRRAPDQSTGLSLWNEAVPIPERRSAGPTSGSPRPTGWEAVIAASRPLEEGRPSEGEDVAIATAAPGDVIQHPTFGRCEVVRIEGDSEFASVRLRNGRLVRLALDVLDLRLTGEEAGRRVLAAKVKA